MLETPNLNTFNEIYDRKNNAFDFLRIILSIMVIYSHCYPLLYGKSSSSDLLEKITKGQISFGSLAVDGFFIISGFLITQSIMNSKTYLSYFKKRLLRILPAFLFSLVLIAFIIGPILTSLDLKTYFLNLSLGSPLSFVINNFTFNIFNYSWSVHDLFVNNPFPSSANGSMWTLKHEMAMYIILPLLSYFFILNNRYVLLLFVVFNYTLFYLNMKLGYNPLNELVGKYWVFSTNEYPSFIRLSSFFLSGTLYYFFKENIPYSNRYLLLSMGLVVFSGIIGQLNFVLLLFLPYILLLLAFKLKFGKLFTKYGDFSYGLYIYSFPIQQLIVALFKDYLNILSYFVISFIMTLFISAFSWHFIEKQALSLKSKEREKNKINSTFKSTIYKM